MVGALNGDTGLPRPGVADEKSGTTFGIGGSPALDVSIGKEASLTGGNMPALGIGTLGGVGKPEPGSVEIACATFD